MNNFSAHTSSPRQRMINLMYLVFIALLALNVSSDTFDVFELLDGKLNNLLHEVEKSNRQIYQTFAEEKEIPDAFHTIKVRIDSVCNYISSLKGEMIRIAEGKDDTEAVARIMLSPVKGEAKQLYGMLRELQEDCEMFFAETQENPSFEFLTCMPSRSGLTVQTWETSLFENKPLGAVLPFMTELELNVRWAENHLLELLRKEESNHLLSDHFLTVSVLPENPLVLYGNKWKGRLVLGLNNLHLVKNMKVNNRNVELKEDGSFELETSSPGFYSLQGEIEFRNGFKSVLPFQISYYVTNPSVTIAPVKMNVLYAGYENELRIAVPGIPTEQINVKMDRGEIFCRQNNSWIAVPDKPGEEANITVVYRQNAEEYTQHLSFRVLKLPDPVPFIVWQDNSGYHKNRESHIKKDILLSSQYLEVGYEDNWLETSFDIVSFELSWFDSFGNRLREKTTGKYITERQKEILRKFPSGKTCWFSGIEIIGEDKIERKLPAMEVVIN